MPLIKINPQFDELFRCSLQVRVADLNYGNHLGNDQILSYFHEGRVLWLNQHSLSEKDVGGCGLIMAATSIEYLAQAYLHQHLELTLGARAVGKARFTIVYKLTEQQTEQTIALGETHMGCFDYQNQKPARAPQSFLAIFT
ncbi:acyl-CoA thioesterase [Oceanospirillaceae bacterium]|jgi:acyl-CoA thioester hydrolase|nr:acyl-CoA thioesterase [Oceanospirillaceae bacterium]MDB9905328.1 acyl-CoA thioesterase [Oceanospirillaceae bacterium]MDC1227624.1 acyl-CoA thioesterase [Oceanospirillaceae bacterium]|tara:strand:+ start:485 stop:907 length:423 start_codon:yes stop_codon:yes gene_type:complete